VREIPIRAGEAEQEVERDGGDADEFVDVGEQDARADFSSAA